jgi:hypothetical protein
MALGHVRAVAMRPPQAAYVVTIPRAADSIWIDIGPPIDYVPLWREVYPAALVSADRRVAPLLSREEAQRAGLTFIRLALVPLYTKPVTPSGPYVLTGTSHSATDASY